jgi:hypothetical protein
MGRRKKDREKGFFQPFSSTFYQKIGEKVLLWKVRNPSKRFFE